PNGRSGCAAVGRTIPDRTAESCLADPQPWNHSREEWPPYAGGRGGGDAQMDRLSALDVSFLYLEEPSTPMHVGGLLHFAPPAGGFDYDGLVTLIGRRISLIPRYRQKVKPVPGHLANPVWVDDPDFDLAYHVRRSALPRPGSDDQLRELAARLISRPLDRNRPLWELYLIEGLSGGPGAANRVAIMTKTHHAMVDGVSSVDIATVILDPTPQPRESAEDRWVP